MPNFDSIIKNGHVVIFNVEILNTNSIIEN